VRRERSLANNFSGGAITAQNLIESLYQKYEITSFSLLIDHKKKMLIKKDNV
jgi:hypothetical protein